MLPEEMQAIYLAREHSPCQLGDIPLAVILAGDYGKPPSGISVEEWKRLNEEKRQQKAEFVTLSRNSRLIVAEKSGHHVALDEPQIVTDAIHLVVDAARERARLT